MFMCEILWLKIRVRSLFANDKFLSSKRVQHISVVATGNYVEGSGLRVQKGMLLLRLDTPTGYSRVK